MATIARFRAVVSIGRLQVTGLVDWLLWLVVHLAFLTGFKNRVSAVAHWTGAFLGRGRRQRTITKQQTLARTEVLELATWSPRGTDQGLHGRNSGATARTSCVPTHSLERRFS